MKSLKISSTRFKVRTFFLFTIFKMLVAVAPFVSLNSSRTFEISFFSFVSLRVPVLCLKVNVDSAGLWLNVTFNSSVSSSALVSVFLSVFVSYILYTTIRFVTSFSFSTAPLFTATFKILRSFRILA